MFTWKLVGTILGVVMLVATITLSAIFFPSCSTFKPIWMKELPAECNMSLNVLQMYYKSADKSGAVPSMQECFSCLKSTKCQIEAFGVDKDGRPGRIDLSDNVRLNYFLNCLARK